MTTLVLFGIPVAALAVVLLVGFVGCGLYKGGLPGPPTPFNDVVLAIPSLVSLWHLDEEGGATAVDSKDGHNGTYKSAPVAAGNQSAAAPGTLQFGQPSLITSQPDGRSISVNGGGAEVPFSADLNTPKFTIQAFVKTAWAKTDEPAYRCVIFAEQSAQGVGRGFSLYANPNNTWEVFVGDGAQFFSAASNSPISLGETDFLAATHDGSTLILYVNGQVAGSAQIAYQPNDAAPLSIGQAIAGPFNAGFPFVGQVDEVAFYNDVLDEQTISNIAMAASSAP